MADPLSVASGIAGLLSLAGAAFRGVHQYIRSVKDAKDFVKALSKELQSLNSILQGVKVLAEAFEQDKAESTVILRLEHVSACKNVLNEIIKETTKIREAIDKQKSISSKIETLRWPFRKSKTEELISELSRHKATLSLACDAASLSALVDCLGKVSETERKLAKMHDGIENLQVLPQIQLDAERERVLNFFMPTDPGPNLQSSLKLRHPGTGAWLTESLRFRTWISNIGSHIWLSGIPGAGKTILAGAAIQEAIQQATTAPNIGVGFFFCDYKNQQTWNILNILGAIAVQLAQQNEAAFLKLQQYHDKIKPRLGIRHTPDADDLYEVIIDESEEFDRIFLVVDGLDECGDDTEQVCKVLSDLARDIPNMSSALFSRDEEVIRDNFQDQFDQIPIAAHAEDISLYVGAELDKRIEQGQLRISDAALKDEILSRLISGAQGMFRWAACQLDALGECVTDTERRAALYELPRTLPQTYERILDRVNMKRHSVQRLVRLSLQFIALKEAWLQLPIKQLCQAVSVPEESGTKWNDSSTVTEHETARACSSFLRKSADGLRFEFAHFSVREYLEDSCLLERPDLRPYHLSESSMSDAIACQYLRFLQLKNFDHSPSQDPKFELGILTKNEGLAGLYELAAISWPKFVHAIQQEQSESSTELLELQKLMLHPEKSNPYLNWAIHFCEYLISDESEMEWAGDRVFDSGFSTLHMAAALDLVEVGTWLLDLETPISSGVPTGSPLEFSIAGVFALADKIVNEGTDLVSDYYIYRSSHSLASELAMRGETLSTYSESFHDRKLMRLACDSVTLRYDFSQLRLLVENGWRLSSEDISIARQAWTGESLIGGYEEDYGDEFLNFVKCLDELGIHKTEWGHEFCTLTWNMAITNRREFTANTSLLPSDITLSEEALDETAIRYIEDDDLEALRGCEQDARFNLHEIKNYRGQYAVHIAAMNGSWNILNYTIDAGVDLRKLDFDGRTVLHALAEHQSDTDDDTLSIKVGAFLGKLIPEFQELMSVVDRQGQTAIGLALGSWDQSIAILMLKHYPIQLGCCHDQECIWDQAVLANSLEVLRTLVDIDLPRHPACAESRPFHLLSPYTDLETLELLHALYPDSLNDYTDGKLAFERCLRRWTEEVHLRVADMDVEVIRALLRYSEPLSPTSSEAIGFCCRLVSGFQYSWLKDRLALLQPFLESGLDVHHEIDGKYILGTACEFFKTEWFRKNEFAISIMEVILDRVDNKKINRPNAAGNTILHIICAATVIDTEWLLPELVKRGADVNIFSGNYQLRTTPLIASLERPSPQSMKSAQILLTLGADPALSASSGWDAAHMASVRGAEPFLQNLLLHITKTSTHFDWIQRCTLLDQWNGSARVFRGLNSLHLASMTGQKDCFDFFVDNSLIEDTHDTSEDGFSCLHFAAFDASARMIDYLIDQGLDIDQGAADGSTPLHVTVQKKNKLGVQRLLGGSPLMKKDIFGMTPMMYARKFDLNEIIELLARYDTAHTDVREPDVLAQGARNRYWRKALETAIMQADVQLCTQIMDEGCPVDISLPECGGCSPLLLSINRSSPSRLDLVRLFLEKSASVCKRSCSQAGSLFTVSEAIRRPYLNRFLPKTLDLCLQEASETVSRGMLLDCLNYGNTEALPIIIKHVCENEADYARFLGCNPGSVISSLINYYGGVMPLHQAVLQSNFGAVVQLVEAGADVNAQDRIRLTPLQYCNAPGAITDYLLSHGATPTLPPSSTWLHYLGHSVKTQKEIATQILRMASYRPIRTVSSLAPAFHPKALVVIMSSGQNLNVKDESNCSIMFAAMCNSNTATLVLNSSIEMSEIAPLPWHMLGGPIGYASCINQHWKQYLCRFGMNEFRRVLNLQPNRGWSPLCLATCTDAIDVMEHCFEMGAEVDFEGSPYGSALMVAAAMNRIESVKFLVRRNASIFYTGKQGFTSAVMAEVTPQRIIEWLLVKRFQDQGKLEATSDSHGAVEDPPNLRARLSWCPTRIQLRLNADFERQPHESLFAYLRRLAIIKEQMRGRIVPVPKPEFIARSKISVVYEI